MNTFYLKLLSYEYKYLYSYQLKYFTFQVHFGAVVNSKVLKLYKCNFCQKQSSFCN